MLSECCVEYKLIQLYQKSSVRCFAFSHASTFELIPAVAMALPGALVTDYVSERTLYTKFDTNPLTGGFWANGWNITQIILYLYLFFSGARTGQTCGWIFTHNSSKDVKSRKDVPFGGLNDVPLNFGGKTIKSQILGAWIGLSSLNDKNFKPL